MISVITSVYNGEKYIAETIESIINQTYRDFEYIIVDNCSVDNTEKIVSQFAKDRRIKFIRNPENIERANARNVGIKAATGDFIAFTDADDISLDTRFEKQIELFKNNTDIILCGTLAVGFKPGYENKWNHYTDHNHIVSAMLFFNSIIMSSVMVRKSAFSDGTGFRHDFIPCEDYDLWSRILDKGKFANIPEYLLRYRLGASEGVASHQPKMIYQSNRIRQEHLKKLIPNPTQDEIDLHNRFSNFTDMGEYGFLEKAAEWLSKLIEENNTREVFPKKEFDEVTARKWYEACSIASSVRKDVYKIFTNTNIGNIERNKKDKIYMLVKSILRFGK